MSNTQTIPIQAKFHGFYNTGLNTPDPQGLASVLNCIRPREDDRVRVTRGQHVIKEAETLSHFIDRIPKKVMDFVRNPPPSDDPLLQRPEIDFESQMMLVITTHNPNLFVDPEIARVELTSETMLVHCRYSEPGPVVQKLISYGEIPRCRGGSIRWRRPLRRGLTMKPALWHAGRAAGQRKFLMLR